jgi:hypothetical protein
MIKMSIQKHAALFLSNGHCIGTRRARTHKGVLQILIGDRWTTPGINIARVEICRHAVAVCSSRLTPTEPLTTRH